MKFILGCITAIIFLFACSKGPAKIDEVEITTPTPGGPITSSNSPFKNYLGVNAFEWDFVEPNQSSVTSETRMSLIKSFGGIRHYLDWEKMESTEGQYTYNPAHSGGAYLDVIYTRLKNDNIDLLVCMKNIPAWLMNTYPSDQRGTDNTPVNYGASKSNPDSYLKQAKMAFQFAARYGSNKNIDASLVSVNTKPRWTADEPNTLKTGLGLVKYIECNNEPDKWWAGTKAQQSAEEYAANLSAFYDGNKGKMGKNVGVKNADPNMIVVMAGLGGANPEYVAKMVEWCRKNRGVRADGTVDLCFDVINYHLYANDAFQNGGTATKGVAPERSELGTVADSFVKMAKTSAPGVEIWVTETGYDVGNTPQGAIAIGSKSTFITQADWNLRTSLLYARHGISRCMFYMLDDAGGLQNKIQYSSSGFHDDFKPRPSADYMLQTKNLIGNYAYSATLNNDPIVDLYRLDKKEIYVLTIPDQKGRVANYQLDLGTATQAIIHTLQVGKNEMAHRTVSVTNGKLSVEVTETPIFVEKL
ncbi:hypothetical protein [Pedobacter aquatilis]|uniref:hypothetical protein n=1 Tax=Pedobacter aquatilis TaxID=351343 RepID=UPI00292F4819|nr:hypothetical protein [Pedobacter aquatilis]